jgi:phosphohistidine phosphatase
MKLLYVIRHAKSSWDDIDLNDFDRPLNERGKRDAPRMAKRLKEKEIVPDLMLSSPAKRALSTAKRMAAALDYPKEKIKTDKTLYHADEETIYSVIHGVKNKHDVLFVFGHNPGLTDFVNSMSNESPIDNVPTCGVVAFSIEINDWAALKPGSARFLFFDFPKSKED